MRVIFILIFSIVCFSAACVPSTYTVSTSVAPGPTVYVFTNSDGTCWADDVWYDVCLWTPGPTYGYYAWYGGGYVYRPGYVWRHRGGRNYPPRSWHPRPPVHRRHR
jgi:hypothetical protein